MWLTEGRIAHSYYEKRMRSQVLTMRRSGQSENSNFSILVNDLNRRFEAMHEKITIEEKQEVVNKYCQQLVSSGYSYIQIREIFISSLKGTKSKEKRLKEENRRYRSNEETLKHQKMDIS